MLDFIVLTSVQNLGGEENSVDHVTLIEMSVK